MKTNIIKKAIASVLTFTLLGSFAACNTNSTASDSATVSSAAQNADISESETQENVVLRVGANVTPHSEILEVAKPILAEQGITLEIVVLEDSITPNTGVIEGSLDANYFQHVPYLEQFNKENGSSLVSVGAVHYEPFGIYAGKTTDLKNLPDGAIVAVPNNVTNEARALLLLDQEGIIKLKDDAGINATVEDIVENPKNIQFKELAPEQLVAALPDVDIAVINGNYAIEGGLHVSQALAVEANDGLAAQTYGNIIATSADKANDPAIAKLVEVLQGPEVSAYIKATYDGAVVPLF
ncbi:D-methionine transport system substrate-binding protein [Ruminococcaceae bacterium YAD3003]|nr:D-methionine transport system substrate-binding protein [Ruminococcaceae bacterium YAD3003]